MQTLLIEDTPADAHLTVRALERGGLAVEWLRVENAAELERALSERDWDLVVSDYNLPGFGAKAALEIVQRVARADGRIIPFILVSGAVGEEIAVELIKAGAADFVMKSNLERLPAIARRALGDAQRAVRERDARDQADRKMRARELFLSMASHDIKNPLNAIDLNLHMIDRLVGAPCAPEDLAARDRKIRAQIASSLRSSARVKTLIHELLDEARIEAGRFQVTRARERVDQLLSEVVELFQPIARDKSIRLELDASGEPAWADFDRSRLHQVLANLVGNALKFTPESGVVRIECKVSDQDLMIAVIDAGPGIPPEHQTRIFERFWQVDDSAAVNKGSGLGLFIAKAIAEAHLGSLRVVSQLGQGSRFEVSIPRWSDHPAAESPAGSDAATPELLQSTTDTPILLVDDDDDLREILEEVLRSHGYQVFAFADAESGLEYLQEHPTPKPLLITDYGLPGMSGMELITEARKIPGLPVILASADRDLEGRGVDLPRESILRKPVTIPDLLSAVGRAIVKKSS